MARNGQFYDVTGQLVSAPQSVVSARLNAGVATAVNVPIRRTSTSRRMIDGVMTTVVTVVDGSTGKVISSTSTPDRWSAATGDLSTPPGPKLPKQAIEIGMGDEETPDVFEEIDALTGGAARDVDVWLNERLGGNPGETISARVGRRDTPIGTVVADALDFVAPGHTTRAVINAGSNVMPCIPEDYAREIAKAYCKGR